MTRGDAAAWVQSLKPGDKVVLMDNRRIIEDEPVAVLTIKKVTARNQAVERRRNVLTGKHLPEQEKPVRTQFWRLYE